MNKKYLFIVTESESANGICAEGVMKSMIARGESVVCLTNREYGMESTFIKDGVEYITVKQRFVPFIDSYLRRGKVSPFRRRLLRVVFKVLNKLKLMSAVFSWPLISRSYCKRYYRAAKRLVRERGIDCIVPVYKQIDPLIVADKLKKEYPSVVTVPYFLDSLSGGYGPKMFSDKQFLKRGMKWERRVLGSADAVIVMESSRSHHEKNNAQAPFFDKLIYLDIPLLNVRADAEQEKEKTEDDKITVLYCGTLTYPMRNVYYINDLLSVIDDEKVRFVFVGNTNAPKAFNSENATYLPPVSHGEVLEMMKSADVLMNIGVTQSSAISGKIFEYMALGKPIISTYSVDDEACMPYLEKYPLALMIDERDPDLKKQASRIRDFVYETLGRRVDAEYVKETFKNNLPESCALKIISLAEGKQK